MSPRQRAATTALLRTALNERGHDKVRALMALEITLRELETFGLSRDPDNYALALYGQPGDGGWGWRIEGHHLSLHFSLEGDRYVATLPQFFGANPAAVPRDVAGGAPRAGFRLLGTEEDTARQWLASLSEAQRQAAIIDTRPYGDIVSRNAARAKPLDAAGLAFADMNATQQALLLTLVAVFAEHLQPELAQARLARVRAAPLRYDPHGLGRLHRAARAVLLPHPGRELPDRVRQLGRQPRPLGVARLRGRLRPRRAARALSARVGRARARQALKARWLRCCARHNAPTSRASSACARRCVRTASAPARSATTR